MASETTTAAISQQHFQSNSNQPIRILPLHRGCAEVRYVADSLNTLIISGGIDLRIAQARPVIYGLGVWDKSTEHGRI